MYNIKFIVFFLVFILSCSSETKQSNDKLIKLVDKNQSGSKIASISDCKYSITLSTPPSEIIDKVRWSFDLANLDKITINVVDGNSKLFDIFLYFGEETDIKGEVLKWRAGVSDEEKSRHNGNWSAVPIYLVPNGHEVALYLKQIAESCGATVRIE